MEYMEDMEESVFVAVDEKETRGNYNKDRNGLVPPEKEEQRELFATWNVSDRSYRLKLGTSAIMRLERESRCNLIKLIRTPSGEMPPLTTMLKITHAAMECWEHGIKIADVERLYDQYLKEGGDMETFYTTVFLKIYAVSGFFSPKAAQELLDITDQIAAEH